MNQVLLEELLNEPFFSLPAPKSTGRELFNLDWLIDKVEKTSEKLTALSSKMTLAPEDVQATLVELTVTSIVNTLNQLKTDLPKRLLVCGGGAKNSLIMRGLHDNLLVGRLVQRQSKVLILIMWERRCFCLVRLIVE